MSQKMLEQFSVLVCVDSQWFDNIYGHNILGAFTTRIDTVDYWVLCVDENIFCVLSISALNKITCTWRKNAQSYRHLECYQLNELILVLTKLPMTLMARNAQLGDSRCRSRQYPARFMATSIPTRTPKSAQNETPDMPMIFTKYLEIEVFVLVTSQ